MMSVSSRSTPAPSPASSSSADSEDEEFMNSSWMESFVRSWNLREEMTKEHHAEKQRHRNKLREKIKDAAFKPEPFGDRGESLVKISDSLLNSPIVSIALFHEDVLLYACSGTTVRLKYGNIQDHHRIIVTSARLAQKFNDNRTRDDNLRIEVRTSRGRTLHGSLGLYDEKEGIALVTSFSLSYIHNVDTSVDLPRDTLNNNLFAFGRDTDGNLMGANCSHPVLNDEGLASVNCQITEIGHGGPVLYFAPDGSEHFAGLIVKSGKDKITLLPAKKLHNWLLSVLEITSKTSHFRGFSLPNGVKLVIPSGFMVQSMILESLSYPLPPPFLFELNGQLAGKFDEYFGELHYWEGYPYISSDEETNPIWVQLGESLSQKMSQSVVSIASFKGDQRCFACSGLLITGKNGPFVLTSASLVRTGGHGEGEIDQSLRIDVFLPRNYTVQGTLKLYHQNYNIAIVHLKEDFRTAICPHDILNAKGTRYNKSGRAAIGRSVVAIARGAKRCDGLLMASKGEVKGKYKAVKRKWSTGQADELDCKDLFVSTCEIKKVGIGGPLFDFDGNFMGMNFYDESRTTPFLPRQEILTVLREGFDLLQSSTSGLAVNMDLSSKTLGKRKRKINGWPVPKPYWYLSGQVRPLDQLVGKVRM